MVIGISSSVLFSTLSDLPDFLVCHAALPSLIIAARDLILIAYGNLSIRVQFTVPPDDCLLLGVCFRVRELVLVGGKDIAAACLRL